VGERPVVEEATFDAAVVLAHEAAVVGELPDVAVGVGAAAVVVGPAVGLAVAGEVGAVERVPVDQLGCANLLERLGLG
jgi:hypothetical protein